MVERHAICFRVQNQKILMKYSVYQEMGTDLIAKNVPIEISDFEKIKDFVKKKKLKL